MTYLPGWDRNSGTVRNQKSPSTYTRGRDPTRRGKSVPDCSNLPDTALDWLSFCAENDIRLYTEGDALKWDAPLGTVTEEVRRALARCKAELFRIVPPDCSKPEQSIVPDRPSTPPGLPEPDPYAESERAALAEDPEPTPGEWAAVLARLRSQADADGVLRDDRTDPINQLIDRGRI